MHLRSRGEECFALSSRPQTLAQGLNGVLEISTDHRLLLGSDGELTSGTPPEVTDTIMPSWDARLSPQQTVIGVLRKLVMNRPNV
ncbi:hypothetical protein ACFLS0_04175 [Candidatus Bipolaricaulota bacterium]